MGDGLVVPCSDDRGALLCALRCCRLPFHRDGVPRLNVFNRASVTRMTPFSVGAKEAETLKHWSHDHDPLTPTGQLVVNRR